METERTILTIRLDTENKVVKGNDLGNPLHHIFQQP
jgi:hypothetical protein